MRYQTYNVHLLRHLRRTIGQHIHTLRAQQKLTLPKFACLTGLSLAKLDQYEIGKNEIGLDELLRITCVLGVKMTDVLKSENSVF